MTYANRSSVGPAVVEAFKAEKVEFVFGLAGSHVLAIFDALADEPQICHVVTKHENNAAFMAGMYGHLTGRPGVVLVTAGPGATNSLSGVAQAYFQSMPMVHISGGVPLGSGNEVFHGVDRDDFLHRMFADVTKWSVRVERAEDVPDILSRAFALAVSGRPGPVHVDIPQNIIQAEGVEMPSYRPSPVEKQAPPKELVRQVRQALVKAQRPMICAGRGVLVHRAEAELVALAEAVSAPVLHCTNSLGVIADDHPLATGAFSQWRGNSFGWELLSEADFVLAVGFRSGSFTVDELVQQAPEHTVLMALDEPHTLTPMEGLEAVAACDSRLFLSRLLAHAGEFRRPLDEDLTERIARHKEAFRRGLAQYMAPYENARPIHFGQATQELVSRLNQDAIVVSGVGNHNMWGFLMAPIRKRDSFIQEGFWATMGSELGGGIAAKLTCPKRQVVVITGDGSLLMSASDFVTAVETGANILVVVLNDSRYGMINAIQRRDFERSFGDEIAPVDFVRFAESFGATGVRVESPEALPDAMERALALSAQTPVILDVVCNYEHEWPRIEAILALGLEQEVSEP